MKSTKAKVFQVQLTPGKVFEIKPNGKYLLLFDREDAPEDREGLALFQRSLIQFFGQSKVLCLFSKDLNSVKIAELLEELQ